MVDVGVLILVCPLRLMEPKSPTMPRNKEYEVTETGRANLCSKTCVEPLYTFQKVL